MPAYSAYAGTRLAYHVYGDGPPVVCLPGGPMRSAAYLGDLGGVAAAGHQPWLDDAPAFTSAVARYLH